MAPLCQPSGREVKINSVDFRVVTQFCWVPKDNISFQVSHHHGPWRENYLSSGQGAREHGPGGSHQGAERTCVWRERDKRGGLGRVLVPLEEVVWLSCIPARSQRFLSFAGDVFPPEGKTA